MLLPERKSDFLESKSSMIKNQCIYIYQTAQKPGHDCDKQLPLFSMQTCILTKHEAAAAAAAGRDLSTVTEEGHFLTLLLGNALPLAGC
jgi:hypothetical protein